VAALGVMLASSAPNAGDELRTAVLRTGRDGRKYWAAEYLIPDSDAWKKRVLGFKPQDPFVAAGYDKWDFYCRDVFRAFGKIGAAVAPAMLGSLAQLCAYSPLVVPGDFMTLFAESNIQRVAAELRDAGKSDGSVSNFVSYCRAFAREYDGAPLPSEDAGKKRSIAEPYVSPTQEAYWWLFDSQRCARTRFETLAVMCGSIGAGGDAKDLRFWRFNDIIVHENGNVDIAWNGLTSRTVPVAEPWAGLLTKLIGQAPDGEGPNWMIRGHRTNRLLSNLFDRVHWGDLARFKAARGRTTWTVERLSNSCRVDTLRELLGVETYTQIGEAARYLPAQHRDDVIASFREGSEQ